MALNTEPFSPPEPWSKVRDWFLEHVPNGERSFTDILEQGDAPGEVLDYCRVRLAYTEHWMSDEAAKDRPITRDPVGPAIRLFDGPWIRPAPWGPVVNVVEADFPVEDEPGMLYRRTALPWRTYEALIEKGAEEDLRRLAGAIYEFIDLDQRARRMLVEVTRGLEEKYDI